MKVLIFACKWCGMIGADGAGKKRIQLPAQFRVIPVECAALVEPDRRHPGTRKRNHRGGRDRLPSWGVQIQSREPCGAQAPGTPENTSGCYRDRWSKTLDQLRDSP